MSIVFLLGAVQALFFVVLMLSKKEKRQSDYILVVWLVAMGLQLLSYYLLYESIYSHTILGVFVLLVPPLIYIHGPLLLLYTYSLTRLNHLLRGKDLLHFIPFVCSMAFYLYVYLFIAKGDLAFFESRPVVFESVQFVFYLLNIFLNPVYVVVVLVKLSEHQQKIRLSFSYVEKINLSWLKVLAIGLGSVSIIVWIVHIISNLFATDTSFSRDFWIFLSMTIFVFISGYFGFKQGVIYKFQAAEVSDTKSINGKVEESQEAQTERPNSEFTKYQTSRLSPEEAGIIIAKLDNLMVKEKAFTRNDLSLDEVASELEISPHTLSQLLNVFVKKNFFNYVNEYRVKHVKQMLTDSSFEKYSLLGIAIEAGFNSKSSFNRIFKMETGMTPSQYKNTPTP